MSVLLLNGSPHKEGCTYTALNEVGRGLEAMGVSTEMLWLGSAPVHGCIACAKCRKGGQCVFEDDIANTLLKAIQEAEGLVIGSPVYYAGPNGALCAVLDRVFFASKKTFAGKPAAAVVSCRRGGGSAALDRLNKYITYAQMPLATSKYWPIVHGNIPDEVRRDEEGMQTLRQLGKNMGWLINTVRENPIPPSEPLISTNFIR